MSHFNLSLTVISIYFCQQPFSPFPSKLYDRSTSGHFFQKILIKKVILIFFENLLGGDGWLWRQPFNDPAKNHN
jgi:hypothetical protein